METPVTLLDRLRQQPNEGGHWERFVRLFTPILSRWAHRFGVTASDMDDLLQDTFTLLIGKLVAFSTIPNAVSGRGCGRFFATTSSRGGSVRRGRSCWPTARWTRFPAPTPVPTPLKRISPPVARSGAATDSRRLPRSDLADLLAMCRRRAIGDRGRQGVRRHAQRGLSRARWVLARLREELTGFDS